MKRILFYLLLFPFLASCQKQADIRTLTVTMDSSINSESQWVYWISLYGNEFNIIDSCFIEKGQREFVLKDTLMNDSVSLTELIFSGILLPWERSSIQVDKADRDIRIENLTSNGLYVEGTTLTGALAQTEARDLSFKTKALNKKISDLKDDLMSSDYNDTITINQITKKLLSTEKYLATDFIINQFDSVKSTTTIGYLIMYLSHRVGKGEISREVADSIASILKQRYPDDVQVSEAIRTYIHRKVVPPPSLRSENWLKRRNDIRYTSYNKDTYKLQDGNVSLASRSSKPPGMYRAEADSSNVPVYKLGSKIGHLKLKDTLHKLASLSDINTDYIFIDFWAAWCGPCVQEIPHLIKVHNKYKNNLSVYAISLDNNEREWRTAIEKYKSRQFINVYAGSWANEDARLITNSFGVTAIPSNFLLDKNRRIIATDLKSNELETKLFQLLKY
ncbi:TlpA family protein disulfide reductase [Dysgonomonas sp. ZJ279]|uniref:TlpA family protein disulfide reductase n=1 Tax=Dysgonomonas sp. ZJ279 TaxID=2709796 RepID=UPI0013EAE582|nr:TlpA disulfide reductase family protein [Dysgonomonas sp. ZJ279]